VIGTDDWEVVGEIPEAAGELPKAPREPSAQPAAGPEPINELDLCFICDCTGSMGQYIKAAQDNIHAIVKKITESQGADVRFALVSYRDHPPQDKTYVTQVGSFTTSLEEMRRYVDGMKAKGGGDGPEAVTAGLHAAFNLPWRPNATKVCVLIADAPPHGLEPTGDGFPNGDPDGLDPLDIARDMAVHSITLYSVGCEPALSQYRFARDFLCTVADMTGGQAVALSSAGLLADVIVNGSAEELCLAKLQGQVEEEVVQVQLEARKAGKEITTEGAVAAAYTNLQARGMQSVQMCTDGYMENTTKGSWGGVAEKKRLGDVKTKLCEGMPAVDAASRCSYLESVSTTLPPASLSLPGCKSRAKKVSCAAAPDACVAPLMPSARAPKTSTMNYMSKDLISQDQVARIVSRAQYQSRLL